MYKVICCMCHNTLYWRRGWAKGVSHSFCPGCLNKYRRQNDLPDRKIALPCDIIITKETVDVLCGIGMFAMLIVLSIIFMSY